MTVKLGFVGDLSLAVLNDERSEGMDDLGRQCQPFTERVDIAIANLESVIVEHNGDCTRKMAVCADKCHGIERLKFDIFSLANNHIRDCGQKSLLFTRSFLAERGIKTVGAGENRDAAEDSLIVEVAGKRLGVLSVTDATHYGAGMERAGVAPLIPRRLSRAVRRLSESVDLAIVCIHSDLEFTNFPAPWKVRLSRRLVRAGAHLVIHHHPHTLQGIERYQGALIAYSLGNFVFPVHGNAYMRGKAGHVEETVFLTVDVKWVDTVQPVIEYEPVAGLIGKDNRLRMAVGEDADRILGRLQTYSDYLQEPRRLRREFFRLCVAEARRFVFDFYYGLRKRGIRSAWRFVADQMATAQHRNWMRGLLTLGSR